MSPEILTPEQIVESVEAGIMAERKRLADARRIVKESGLRIMKVEKLVRTLRRTFSIPEPTPFVTEVPQTPKPPGIALLDEVGRALYSCEDCTFTSTWPTALASHRRMHARHEEARRAAEASR